MDEEFISFEKANGLFSWTIDTSRHDILGYQRNPKVQEEISDWDKAKPFFDKYGLILNYPDNYIPIFC